MALEKRDTPIIATLEVEAQPAKGDSISVTVKVGTPYRCMTGEWACPVRLNGLYDELPDARGEGSMQALCMALSLALELLQSIRDQGGRLSWKGDEFPLEAYAFGVARKV